MMRKAKPTDFLLNTDYEMDKIILYKTGTLNKGDYNIQVPHNLKFKPLVFGVFSDKEDFSSSFPIPYNNVMRQSTLNVDVWADATNITLSYTNTASTPAKIYYRIYGFEPSNSHAKVGATSKYANQLILNTDYNYCKLKEKDVVDTPSNYTIQHNLGYLPQVLVWHESAGNITPVWVSYPYNSYAPNVKVTEQAVILNGFERAHYRIYYDEA